VSWVSEPVATSPNAVQATGQKTESLPVHEPVNVTKKNTPLDRHENEKVQELANLYEDLVIDVESMPPEAASYFRERPWLTPEVCQKWGIGYLPKNGRSMFRSWIVYTHRNQRGEVLSYSGRDPNFDRKWNKWIRDGRPESKKPMKHKYVKGFMKGNELFGQQVSRLEDERLAESASSNGLFVVEGMNDVVKLDTLGIASVGICSNRATDAQVEMIAKFANRTSGGRVVLLPDCDEEGENGFKELMWRLAERNVDTKLGWSKSVLDLKGETIQPENLDEARLAFVMERIS
jgi:5S rRNA maturation endonuclease (ribonuclease M5)